MTLKRELLFSLGTLVLLNLVLAFSSIGLLGRMAPAVEQILRDNVQSLEAAETMLEILAVAPDPLDGSVGDQLESVLTSAQHNVTEAAEPAVLRRLHDELIRAERGEPDSRRALVSAISDLASVNRAAMRRSDESAQRLSLAGGWAAALVGALSLWLCLYIALRLRRRLLVPVLQLSEVLRARGTGDMFRRVGSSDAGEEWRFVLAQVDHLLDEASARTLSSIHREDALATMRARRLSQRPL